MVKDRAGRGVSDANDAHRPGAVCLRLPSGSKVAAGRPMTSAPLPLLGRAAVGEGAFHGGHRVPSPGPWRRIQPDPGVSFLGVLVGLLELGVAAGRNPGGLFGSMLRLSINHTKNGIRNESWK